MPGRFSKQAPETCQVVFSIFFECDQSVPRDETLQLFEPVLDEDEFRSSPLVARTTFLLSVSRAKSKIQMSLNGDHASSVPLKGTGFSESSGRTQRPFWP